MFIRIYNINALRMQHWISCRKPTEKGASCPFSFPSQLSYAVQGQVSRTKAVVTLKSLLKIFCWDERWWMQCAWGSSPLVAMLRGMRTQAEGWAVTGKRREGAGPCRRSAERRQIQVLLYTESSKIKSSRTEPAGRDFSFFWQHTVNEAQNSLLSLQTARIFRDVKLQYRGCTRGIETQLTTSEAFGFLFQSGDFEVVQVFLCASAEIKNTAFLLLDSRWK